MSEPSDSSAFIRRWVSSAAKAFSQPFMGMWFCALICDHSSTQGSKLILTKKKRHTELEKANTLVWSALSSGLIGTAEIKITGQSLVYTVCIDLGTAGKGLVLKCRYLHPSEKPGGKERNVFRIYMTSWQLRQNDEEGPERMPVKDVVGGALNWWNFPRGALSGHLKASPLNLYVLIIIRSNP